MCVRACSAVQEEDGACRRCVSSLTLVDLEEGLRQLAGEQRLGQIPEVLLQHVCHVVGRLALVVDPSPVGAAGFVHLAESLDARLDSRLPEESHLETGKMGFVVTSLGGPSSATLTLSSFPGSISVIANFDPAIMVYQK